MRSPALLLIALACAGAQAEPKAAREKVLVELFTSQGCSSCPPADTLLGEIGKRPDVVALSFHVDYWNYLGWKDPFSQKSWSARQRSYKKRVYTPQLIVDGREHVVGSQRKQVGRALTRALARRAPSVLGATAVRKDGDLRVGASATGADGQILVAVYENGAVTRVRRGENAGRTLKNQHIVRALKVIGTVRDGRGRGQGTIAIDKRWAGSLGVAIWVQDPHTHAVHAVASPPIAD